MSNVPPARIRDVILDSIADGVFTVDEQWKITSFERAAEEITGVSREHAIGQHCFDVFQANFCQTRWALRDTMGTGRCWVDQRIDILNSRVLNSRGEKVPVSISTSVLRDESGRSIGGVETFRDLSTLEMLRKEIDHHYTYHDIVSKNYQLRRILETLPDLAAVKLNVRVIAATNRPLAEQVGHGEFREDCGNKRAIAAKRRPPSASTRALCGES